MNPHNYITIFLKEFDIQLNTIDYNIAIKDLKQNTTYYLNNVADKNNEFTNFIIVFDPNKVSNVFNHPDNYYVTSFEDLKVIVTYMVNHPEAYSISYQ